MSTLKRQSFSYSRRCCLFVGRHLLVESVLYSYRLKLPQFSQNVIRLWFSAHLTAPVCSCEVWLGSVTELLYQCWTKANPAKTGQSSNGVIGSSTINSPRRTWNSGWSLPIMTSMKRRLATFSNWISRRWGQFTFSDDHWKAGVSLAILSKTCACSGAMNSPLRAVTNKSTRRECFLRWLPTVTVQLNIDQSLRDENDFTFRFLMLNNSLRGMKTSFVFVSQEIRKQKLL